MSSCDFGAEIAKDEESSFIIGAIFETVEGGHACTGQFVVGIVGVFGWASFLIVSQRYGEEVVWSWTM